MGGGMLFSKVQKGQHIFYNGTILNQSTKFGKRKPFFIPPFC
jgi:hypothetical protein